MNRHRTQPGETPVQALCGRSRFIPLVLLTALLLAGSVRSEKTGAQAAEPAPMPARYLFSHYTVEQGLIQDQTNFSAQDRRGYIWVGTNGGLSSYDGTGFRSYSLAEGLPDTVILNILPDRSGRIWVGTNYGVACLRNGRFAPVVLRGLPRKYRVNALAELPDGTLAIGVRRGLVLLRGDTQTLLTSRDGLPDNNVWTLEATPDGTLWIGSRHGLSALRGGKIFTYPQLNRDKEDYINAFCLDPRTGDLVITRNRRIEARDLSGRVRTLVELPDLKEDLGVTVVDRTGTLWTCTTGDGLFYRPPGEEVRHIDVRTGLSTNIINHLQLDYENNLWICTDAGLTKLANRAVTLFNRDTGLLAKDAWFAAPFQGRMLVGTLAGCQFLTPRGIEPRGILPQCSVVEYCPLPDGSLLLGTEQQGVYRYTGSGEPAGTQGITKKMDVVWKIHPLPDGRLLLGTGNGLWAGRFPSFTRVPFPDWIEGSVVNDIIPVSADRFWLGTDKGIAQATLRGEQIDFERTPLMKGADVLCFCRLPRGDILVGTVGSGVYRSIAGRPPEVYNILPPGSNPNIWAITTDARGTAWIGTSRGVYFFQDGVTTDFNALYGIPYSEVTGKRSIHFEPDGTGYFATTTGLTVFRPEGKPFAPPPRGVVTEIRVAEKAVPVSGARLELGYLDSISLSFKCLSFTNERGNRYQVRLDGVDSDWQTPQAEDHIFYPFLPPGDLIFRLRVINSRGQATEVTPPVRLRVNPPFTRTPFFYLLIAGVAAVVISLLIGYKLHADKREKERLVRVVREKTSELQVSEEKYRHLVEASPIGIAIVQDNRVVFVNPIFPRILKFIPEELVGREFDRLIHPDDLGLFKEYETLRTGGDTSPHEYEVRLLCSDQSLKSVLLHANLTLFRSHPAILVNVTDITEKKRMQEQLIHYQKLESIGTLAGGIAHDFNNIMQGIAGLTSLIRMQLDPGSPFHPDLALIEDATAKAAVLTRKLLGFARRGKYVITRLEIHEIIESVITFSRGSIPLNIEFVRRFSPESLYVQGDRSQMEQVFLNLFLNSREALPGGGSITITTRLETILTDQDQGGHTLVHGEYVVIVVEDNGYGISPEQLPKIFDPFFTTKPQERGSGLGMATVYGTVKNHLGYIYLDSEVGKGTRVTIYLPHFTPLEGHVLETAPVVEPPVYAPEDFVGKTILVVEDESTIRQFLRKLLVQMQMKVHEAENGIQALQVFRMVGDEVDLVLLDINMPLMDGKEAFQKLREIRPNVNVLILSGFGEDVKIQSMLRDGCRGFISKPIDARNLLSELGAALKPPAVTQPPGPEPPAPPPSRREEP